MVTEALPKFFKSQSKSSHSLITSLRQREIMGGPHPLKTAAAGFDKNSEAYWLVMFHAIFETG